MPEGDTIHRAARTLSRALVGQRVVAARSGVPGLGSRVSALSGCTVAAVEARGKHLLIHLDDGQTLRTHMRMTGSWHLYRPGERWRKPAARARVVLETDAWTAVCFNAPDIELERSGRLDAELDARLGPDLLAEEFDADGVAARWASEPSLPIGVAVMRQRLAAGIGNVYKSELLFLLGIDPFVQTGGLPRATLRLLAREARTLLLANLGPGPRTTRRSLDPGRLWVYGRSGEPCRRCGTPIRMRRQGEEARSTYFCPVCQPPGSLGSEGPPDL
ncbi:MAG: DNA-formamidopyrimidine glycosylase family protein [Gemmatimonadota bacterium]